MPESVYRRTRRQKQQRPTTRRHSPTGSNRRGILPRRAECSPTLRDLVSPAGSVVMPIAPTIGVRRLGYRQSRRAQSFLASLTEPIGPDNRTATTWNGHILYWCDSAGGTRFAKDCRRIGIGTVPHVPHLNSRCSHLGEAPKIRANTGKGGPPYRRTSP
jgi:hypothetical protein